MLRLRQRNCNWLRAEGGYSMLRLRPGNRNGLPCRDRIAVTLLRLVGLSPFTCIAHSRESRRTGASRAARRRQ